MTDNIDVVVKESGSSGVVTSFDNVAAAAQRAHASVSILQKTLSSVGRSTAAANRVNALGTAAAGATGHVKNLNSAMTSLNNTRVTSNLNSANNALQNTGTNARTAASGVRDLLAAFISFHAIKAVIGTLVETQIAMQQIHYGLLAATGSAHGAAEQFEYLRKNANTLGLDLKTSAQEYTRLAASATAMNVAVEDQQKLYTSLSQASTVLHLDAQKVQFATLALTQMFSKGKIQAEELRRQLGEAIPGVVPRFQRAVMEMVKGTDLARYSFEELMKRGLLDTKKFLPGLISALTETGRGWEQAAKGLNAEINRLKTAWFELRVEITKGIFNDAMIAIVRFLSGNLKELTGLVVGLGIALSVALAPAAIIKFTGYVKELAVAVWAAAGPWGLLAAAIAGVIGYIVTMRDEIKLGVDETTTLGDMMRAAWEGLVPTIQSVGKWINETLGGIGTAIAGTFNELINRANGYEHENEAMWLRILRVVVRVFDMIGGVIRATFMASQAVLAGFVNAFVNNFKQIGNVVTAIMSGDVEGIKDAVKSNLAGYRDAALNAGEVFGKVFQQEILRQSESGLESVLDSWIKEAQRISKERTAAATGGGGAVPTTDPTSPPKGDGGKAAKELDKLKQALARLIGEINPTEAALRKLAEAQEILDKAVGKHLITQERADWVMGRLRDKYKDVLKPLEALVDKYREEREILQYTGDEYEVQSVVLQRYHEWKKKNYDISRETVEKALRPEIEATQEATRAQQAYNQVLQDTVYARRSELESIKAVGAARAAGDITPGQAAQKTVGMFGEEALQHTQEGAAAQLQTLLDFNNKVTEAETARLISHQTAMMLMAQADQEYTAKRLSYWSGMFGQLATLSSHGNKKIARIGKAAALAQAIIDGVSAVQKAWASAPYPYNLPAVAVTTISSAANVAAIANQDIAGFRTGGNMTVGGSGGPDSQLVQFYATPGENINVNTPAQARAMEETSAPPQVTVPVTVVNVDDPQRAVDAMDTASGKNVIMNHMQSDPAAFKRALGLA